MLNFQELTKKLDQEELDHVPVLSQILDSRNVATINDFITFYLHHSKYSGDYLPILWEATIEHLQSNSPEFKAWYESNEHSLLVNLTNL